MKTSGHARYDIIAGIAAVLLTACGGSWPPIGAPGAMPQASASADRVYAGMSWKIYVANASYPTGSVTVYTKHADGNVAPVQTISGSNTGLVQPEGIVVDDAGKLYVSDFFGSGGKSDDGPSQQGVVFVFAAKADGNVKPIATIHDGLNYPDGVALDRTGNLYVANFQGCDITVYAARTYKLIRTITSAGSIGLCYVDGIALDGAGNTYVVDTNYSGHDVSSNPGFVLVFGPGANGRVLPIRVIAGPLTKLTAPYGIAVNSRGEIYVTNYANRPPKPEILVFAAGATGNVKPVRTIRGPMTQLVGAGIALDRRGTIFIANDPFSGTDSVTAYHRHARGDASPMREISGDNTGLDMPSAVAIGP
jgi:sugar lactone lactonase YvrE